QLEPQVVGDRNDRRGAAQYETRCGANPREPADVANVAAVRGDDERGSAGQRTDEARGNEEVRIDDVRSEAARSCAGRGCQPEVLHLGAAPPIENRAPDVVASRD